MIEANQESLPESEVLCELDVDDDDDSATTLHSSSDRRLARRRSEAWNRVDSLNTIFEVEDLF